MAKSFTQFIIERGGNIHPLQFKTDSNGGLFNPSILNVGDELIINIRHCQYALLHTTSEWESRWGGLIYLNPETDITLTTTNWLGSWRRGLEGVKKIDTSVFDTTPLWEFVGLEDCRLTYWDDKLFLSGVRRDTETTGIGRMELSEIRNGKEVSRFRIPAPNGDSTYCEKNWMPVTDLPYHYVKWMDPVEVVKININGDTECVHIGEKVFNGKDMRGGSQVIPFGEHRICIVHETDYWRDMRGYKDAIYRHRIVVMDTDWNVIHRTEPFHFMGGRIEFCSGITQYRDKIWITFGYSDNSAYLLEVPIEVFKTICYEGINPLHKQSN